MTQRLSLSRARILIRKQVHQDFFSNGFSATDNTDLHVACYCAAQQASHHIL